MKIRGKIPKNPSLQQFWTPKTVKSYETNLNRYFCTEFIDVKVKNMSLKKNLEIVANFGNLQSGLRLRLVCQFVEKYKKSQVCQICKTVPKNCQMYQFVEEYLQNSRLTNWQIFEIRKIVRKVTKCADSWRNTEKSEFAKFENFWNLQDNLTIRQMCRFVEKHNIKIQVGNSRHLCNSQQNEKL